MAKKYIRKKKKYISISFDMEDETQSRVADWIMKFLPKNRGDAIVELYNKVNSDKNLPLTFLESRLLKMVEDLLGNNNRQKTEPSRIREDFVDTLDNDGMLDSEIDKLLS